MFENISLGGVCKNHHLCVHITIVCIMEDLNRLKVVLVEKKRTSRWLASELGKNPSTVSKWCTNVSQPNLSTLNDIARLLKVDPRDLLNGKE